MFEELRKRHLLQIALVYLGVGWLFIEISDFIVGNYGFSRKILDTVVMLAILGFPAFLIIGWFHGERGHQRVQHSEAWMLVTLVVMGAIGTYRIATGEPIPDPAGAELAETAPSLPDGEGSLVTDDPARIEGPSLAVLPFKNNISDPELDWLGAGLADLFTTNFAQLPWLQVVGRQRLFDLLTEEGRSEDDEIPESLASTVARASGAGMMLWGTVGGRDGDYVIDAQVIDVETGAVRAAERARGSDVFVLVDSLTNSLVTRLGSSPPGAPPPVRISRLGTRDMEALGAFHQGVTLEREGKFDEAAVLFEQAAGRDTMFALPLLRLAGRTKWRDPEALTMGEAERSDVELEAAEDQEAGAAARMAAERYRARAIRIFSTLGHELGEMEGKSGEEWIAQLDSTLAGVLADVPEFVYRMRVDTAGRPIPPTRRRRPPHRDN